MLARLYLAVISPEAARLSVDRGGIGCCWGGASCRFMLGRLASPKTAGQQSGQSKLVQNITAGPNCIARCIVRPSQPQISSAGLLTRILLRKPNILIFVESYGSVLAKQDDWRECYTDMMTAYTARLAADGWYAATALSESPTWGGGSWMAYTEVRCSVFRALIPTTNTWRCCERIGRKRIPISATICLGPGCNYTRVSSSVSDLEDVDWGARAVLRH